ncbi:MAG: hypothetical protein AB7P76_08195 [Candidatus Melainabacteria bacterium]
MNATLPLPAPLFEERLTRQAHRRQTAAAMAAMYTLAQRHQLTQRLFQSLLLVSLLVLPYLFLPG